MKTFKLLFALPFLFQLNFLSGEIARITTGDFAFWCHSPEMNVQKRLKTCYPYISGDVFRNFCDFIFDETNLYFDVKKVKDGDIIFVRNQNDFLDYFFVKFHPNIEAEYILITHNALYGDIHLYEKYLSDENLVAWFGKNLIIDHPKAAPIPLGVPC